MNYENTVLIVIPTFSEEERLPNYLCELFREALKRPTTHFTFLLSDDDSPDRTIELCTREYKKHGFESNLRFDVLNNGGRYGKGNAVIKGFSIGEFDYKGFIDADGAISAEEVFAALDKLVSTKKADGILGVRIFDKTSSIKRRVISLLCLIFAHVIVFEKPVNDAQCPLKFFRSKFLDRMLPMLKSKSGLLDVELIHLSHRFNGVLIDYSVFWQNDENSRIKLKNEIMFSIFRLFAIRMWHHGSKA